MTSQFERFATGLLVVAALAVAVAVVHREFGPSGSTAPTLRSSSKEFVRGWEDLLDDSASIALRAGDVIVVQFSDLECPFCRRFHLALRSAVTETGVRVRNVFVHYPLPQHRFAIPSAKAAECAREQGRFEEFVDAIFLKQDSLGLRPWTAYAHDAGVGDSIEFNACIARPGQPTNIELGRKSGDQLRVSGTPTVLINGWRYSIPPYDSLTAVLRAAASERPAR